MPSIASRYRPNHGGTALFATFSSNAYSRASALLMLSTVMLEHVWGVRSKVVWAREGASVSHMCQASSCLLMVSERLTVIGLRLGLGWASDGPRMGLGIWWPGPLGEPRARLLNQVSDLFTLIS